MGLGKHSAGGQSSRRSPWGVLLASVLIVVAMVLGLWFATSNSRLPVQEADDSPTVSAEIDKASAVPEPVLKHHGNSPDCPDTDCIALLVNGDVLIHENLWKHFVNNLQATDGTAFDFDPLFEPMRRYIDASDVSVCQFETPVAKRGGPYAAYPIFNTPPEVVDSVAHVGYDACTHATNHSWDQGADGIARTIETMQSQGLAQTGSYMNEAASTEPMILDSRTGGGSIAIIAGTVSLNGEVADADWRVDRLREGSDAQHQADIDKAVAKANLARERGADVVAMSMHSLQEYLDYADSWQISEAHELADTGAFDLIYGAGCHCAQPIERYNDTWIIYGLGNAVTVTAPQPGHEVNNQGLTVRVQFAGKRGDDDSWRITRIDWLPTANVQGEQYRWCPISSDLPDGPCWGGAKDTQVHDRISKVIYSMGADPAVVREWKITEEDTQ